MRSQNKVTNNQNTSSAVHVSQLVEPVSTHHRDLIVGLEILEYLANCQGPATLSSLSTTLSISYASIRRSILILEQRGYVVQAWAAGAYEGTGKLSCFQSTEQSHQRLLGHARPIMQSLSDRTSQACNLAIPSSLDMRVVAQQASSGPFGINVPLNFRYDIPASAPGLAFAAFTKNSDPARWPEGLSIVVDAHQWTPLKNLVQKTAEVGYAQVVNPHLPDVIDLSCPIFDNGQFVAALTVPYIKTKGGTDLNWCLATLQMAAEHLNETLSSDALVA